MSDQPSIAIFLLPPGGPVVTSLLMAEFRLHGSQLEIKNIIRQLEILQADMSLRLEVYDLPGFPHYSESHQGWHKIDSKSFVLHRFLTHNLDGSADNPDDHNMKQIYQAACDNIRRRNAKIIFDPDPSQKPTPLRPVS